MNATYPKLAYVGSLRRYLQVERGLRGVLRPYRGKRTLGALLSTVEADMNNHLTQYVNEGYMEAASVEIPASLNDASPLREVTIVQTLKGVGDVESFTVVTTLS